MEIRIKKRVVYEILEIIPLGLGLFLITVFFEGLNKYGIRGYTLLAIFLISGFYFWEYEKRKKAFKIISEEIADEVAEKATLEYKDKFTYGELLKNKADLKEHLIKRSNEKDVFIIPLPFFKKHKQETITTYPDIPDVVKQEFIKRAKK